MTVIEFEDMFAETKRMALEIRGHRDRDRAGADRWERALPLARSVLGGLQQLPVHARRRHRVVRNDSPSGKGRPLAALDGPQLTGEQREQLDRMVGQYEQMRRIYWSEHVPAVGGNVFDP